MQEEDLSSPNVKKKYESLLVEEVQKARDRAYAPYSRFYVGAAVLCEDADGELTVVHGCNVENGSFGMTICAERVALTQMIARGYGSPKMLAVYADTKNYISPCGACRQVISELAPEADVLLLNSMKEIQRVSVSEILPFAFVLDEDEQGE